MRKIAVLMFLTFLVSPRVVNGQSLALYGAAGPTIIDTGHSVAAGVGFSPHPHWSLVFNVERTHVSSWTRRERDVVTSFRGGTLFLGTAEVRWAPLGRRRFGPYGLAGLAAGVSRPNVNDAIFRNPVTNQVRAVFAGGGVDLPLSERMTVFADARVLLGAEGNDGMVGVAPLRAGIAWRF